MANDDLTLDMLWDAGAAVQQEATQITLRSTAASVILETVGRVRRVLELVSRDGVVPELAPSNAELRLLPDLAGQVGLPRVLRDLLTQWIGEVEAVLATAPTDVEQAMETSKVIGDVLLRHVAPRPRDLEHVLSGPTS